MSYSSDVVVHVPVEKFDLNQQAYFKGAVESLDAMGGTATYDGIAVGLDMLMDAMEKYPDAKPLLFVLSEWGSKFWTYSQSKTSTREPSSSSLYNWL